MSHRGFRVSISVAVLIILLRVGEPHAASVDPLNGVTSLAKWFRDLVENFDQFVEQEKRGQLLRSVDRLRKALFQLETETRLLLQSIPDERPTPLEHTRLDLTARLLLVSVRELGDRVREVGADLRLANASEIERRLTAGLVKRGEVLTWLQEYVRRVLSGLERWTPEEVRARLRTGLAAVADAQLAATEFQNRLARKD